MRSDLMSESIYIYSWLLFPDTVLCNPRGKIHQFRRRMQIFPQVSDFCVNSCWKSYFLFENISVLTHKPFSGGTREFDGRGIFNG